MANKKGLFGGLIPDKYMSDVKSSIDPLGVDPLQKYFWGDDPEDEELKKFIEERERLAAERKGYVDEFIAGGAPQYSVGDEITYDQLSRSELNDIKSNPEWSKAEIAALKDLERISAEGFTDADRSQMARLENEVNRANRGRQGAIEQNMQARGMSGSGMEIVAKQQAAQDANEISALRALEREAMGQENRSRAMQQRGSLASQLSQRDFDKQRVVAEANDRTNKFNNDVINSAKKENHGRKIDVMDKNVAANHGFRKDKFNAQTGSNEFNFDFSTDNENARLLRNEQEAKRKAGAQGLAMGAVGAIGGGYFGGPQGAQAGYQAGQMGGQVAGDNAARRDQLYRSDRRSKEDIENESDSEIERFLDSLSPKKYRYIGENEEKHGVIAQDLEESNIGESVVTEDATGMKNINVNDAISALFQAVSFLNKKRKG